MLKMKYRMFLMRLIDRVFELIAKNDLDWYLNYKLGLVDLKTKIDGQENLIIALGQQIEYCRAAIDYMEYDIKTIKENLDI